MVVLAVVGFIVLIFAGVTWGIGRSDAVALIIQTAQQNTELQAEIGAPMTASPWVSGNYKDVNGVGSADVSVTLTGPKGKAEISAKASRPKGGQWQVDEAKAKVQDTGKEIQLVAPAVKRVVAAHW
jgi:preprotein translocase subunit SecF